MIEQLKDGLKGEKNPTKKSSSLTFSTSFAFFGSFVPYNKNDFHQKQFEEDVVLLITKELVPLSFIEVPCFRRLIFR
jgi:hypothetical protein